MKMYHPPVKKSQQPHKDPFLNRMIVQRDDTVPRTARSKTNFASPTIDVAQAGYSTASGSNAFPNSTKHSNRYTAKLETNVA